MDWGRLALSARLLITDILDAVMPPHAHTARTQTRRFEDIPILVRHHRLLGQDVTTLMDYRAREVQDMIRSLKYDGNAHAAALCAGVLADFLREEIASERSFSPRPIFIIPLPLHRNREDARGFNQIGRVLSALPPSLRDGATARVAADILKRTRDTPHQTSLSRAERLSNVRDAFSASAGGSLLHARVYVIDDVTTTGATLAAAYAALQRAGAEPRLIALARA